MVKCFFSYACVIFTNILIGIELTNSNACWVW